jgi:hypothetical protein
MAKNKVKERVSPPLLRSNLGEALVLRWAEDSIYSKEGVAMHYKRKC